MSQPIRQHYYSNPAFCQKSEYYPNEPPRQRALSPERRHPPIGAQKPPQHENYSPVKGIAQPRVITRKTPQKTIENEDQYEEMLVDDTSLQTNEDNFEQNGNRQFAMINGNQHEVIHTNKGRYAIVKLDEEFVEDSSLQKSRYEYIPMQEQIVRSPKVTRNIEENHRYAAIPSEEDIRPPQIKNQGRYAEIPPQGFSQSPPNKNIRYAPAPKEDPNSSRHLVSPMRRIPDKHRYEYIPDEEEQIIYEQQPQMAIKSPITPRKGNPEATQKLHELLITPKKFQKQNLTPQKLVQKTDPFQTPKKVQQKLNYAISTRNTVDKRHNTAVIAPICSSPVQSVYSETTFSNKTESWMNLSLNKKPVQSTIACVSIMMILCGGLSSGLCFYMVSIVGRMYYLDFGIISGFACLLLGCMGFRGRHCHWLPNRNYISGYIVLSLFSLLTCAGLLVLLFLQPKPGSALADVTSGAVCGISGLSLILASTGVLANFCWKYPPPDNRVQHGASGFTV